ncbi:FtsX-like permease family protein [Streptomyces apocyni]|uniref:FtsX-like permease family protein n=1 Tax=Streptomyces apocyni TaxID=2654677 RepID=UPI0012EA03FF|nr:FtsX-like permease family protein [Streptomyces apocyni]
MRADATLAWALLRGSDRREWWRTSLTALGALLATFLGLAAVTVGTVSGHTQVPYGNGLLDEAGTRMGVVVALLGLLIPVLGFLGQCARLGAVHRDRRLAALRLAGATPAQVRRIAALESGFACLAGAVLALCGFVVLLLAATHTARPPLAWLGYAVVTLGVPAVAVLVSVLALRRVVASPLGWVRRTRPERSTTGVAFTAAGMLAIGGAVAALLIRGSSASAALFPLAFVAALALSGLAAVSVAGASAKLLGKRLATSSRPAVLIAAGRLRMDPWAASRTHASVLLVTVVAVGFMGLWQLTRAQTAAGVILAENADYYLGGYHLTGLGLLLALAISLGALAIGTAESLTTRRRALAAQAAAGVPRSVLRRALLLETALPLAPAVLLAGVGGMGLYATYASMMATVAMPVVLPLLTPLLVYAICLLAAAASLPLLRRAVRPAELRHE